MGLRDVNRVGERDGHAVGCEDAGDCEGACDVGLVGLDVGRAVGLAVGLVGANVDAAGLDVVGAREGACVGLAEGASDSNTRANRVVWSMGVCWPST